MLISALVIGGREPFDFDRRLNSLAWADDIILVLPPAQQVDSEIIERFQGRVRVWSAPRCPVRLDLDMTAAARHDWVLGLAEDEGLAEDAGPALRAWLDESADSHAGLALPRFNYLGDHLLTGPEWYPDHQVCLFNRKLAIRSEDALLKPPISGRSIAVLNPPHCPHLHRRLGHNLKDYLDRRLNHLLSASYPTEPDSYDWAVYLAQAQESLTEALETGSEADFAQALKLLTAWEVLVRGLLHWDSLDPKPLFKMLPAFPVVVNRMPTYRVVLRRVFLKHLPIRFQARLARSWLQSRWWRLRDYCRIR